MHPWTRRSTNSAQPGTDRNKRRQNAAYFCPSRNLPLSERRKALDSDRDNAPQHFHGATQHNSRAGSERG